LKNNFELQTHSYSPTLTEEKYQKLKIISKNLKIKQQQKIEERNASIHLFFRFQISEFENQLNKEQMEVARYTAGWLIHNLVESRGVNKDVCKFLQQVSTYYKKSKKYYVTNNDFFKILLKSTILINVNFTEKLLKNANYATYLPDFLYNGLNNHYELNSLWDNLQKQFKDILSAKDWKIFKERVYNRWINFWVFDDLKKFGVFPLTDISSFRNAITSYTQKEDDENDED
jgi:hypothetical protein